ncbi:MAG TPA: response regulator [Candidatus Angelobacter sp.]|nr:response regulator [Candidatus Angelobacter sp.]
MSGQQKHRILCVSGSVSQLRAIVSHFPQDEFETIASSSPEEAVAYCAANHISAIVLDSEFATEDGWTVAQSFRMVKSQLPIVLLNAGPRRELPLYVDAIACKVEMILGALKVLLKQCGVNEHVANIGQAPSAGY